MDTPISAPEARAERERVSRELASGPIGKLLLAYSIPAIVGTAAASLYNLIDRAFIGHGVGAMAISGLALTFPVMNLAAAFGALVGAGAASLVSIRMGEGRPKEADAILGSTLFLNVVLGLCITVLGLAFLDRILLAMGASRETLPYARSFMQVILLGKVFTHLYLGLNGVMRASGYPRKDMVTTLLTVGVNLALAPFFIFVLRWGIRGAALATVCAQAFGALLTVRHFLRRDSAVRFVPGCWRPRLGIIRDIFAIGMSNFTTLLCVSLSAAVYNVQLGRHGGDYAVGAFGILNGLASLFIMVVVGVVMGMQPIAGFNYGARRFDRVLRAHRGAVLAATAITTCGFLLGELFPAAVARAFTDDPRLVAQAVTAQRFIFAVYPLVGFQIVTSGFFQAIGRAKVSVVLSLSRQLLFLVPLLVLLPLRWGLTGVWMAEPVADLSATLVTFLVLRAQVRKHLGQER